MIGNTKMRIAKVLIAILLIAVGACTQKDDTDSVYSFVPKNPGAIAVIRQPDLLLQDTMRWLERALGPTGRPIADRLRRESQNMLGFDPVTSSLTGKLTLDDTVGFIIFSATHDDEPLLLARSTKPETLPETLLGWYRRIDTSARMERIKSDKNVAAHIRYGTPFGNEIVPKFILRQLNKGWFLISHADQERALLAYKRPMRSESLAADTPFLKMMGTKERTLQLWAPPASLFGDTDTALSSQSRGVLSAIDISAKGLEFISETIVDSPALLQALQSPALRPLLEQVDAKSALVFATHLAKSSTLKALDAHPPWKEELLDILRDATQETGLDIQAQVIPQLRGDIVVHAGLTPTSSVQSLANLTKKPSISLLSDQIRGAVLLGLNDPKAMAELLHVGMSRLNKEGGNLQKRTTETGHLIIEPKSERPSFGWSVVNNLYVYAIGYQEIDRTIAALLKTTNPSDSLARSYGDTPNQSIAIMRLGVLSEAITELQKDIKVTGPLKELLVPALQALGRIGDISFSFECTDNTLRFKLSQTLP